MRSRLVSLLRSRRVRLGADALLVGALLAGSLVEIWFFPEESGGWVGPDWLLSALALGATLPLLVRREWPLLAFGLVLASVAAIIAFSIPVQGPFEPFVAIVVALYAVGAHASERRGVAGLALFFAGFAVPGLVLVLAGKQRVGDLVPAVVWLSAAWLVGRIIRGRHLRTLELEDLTAQLELEREERARTAVLYERTRIARELHDVIGHNVSVIVVQAGAASRVLEGEQPVVRNALATIEETGRQTVDEMRRLLGILRRSDDRLALAPQPGLGLLDGLLDQVRAAGLPVELRVEGEPEALPTGLDLTAYRIVQEALTNALKHAGPARAVVTVRYLGAEVELEVSDDGSGDDDVSGAGHGLIGMRERVAVYGGRLEAGRPNGGGYVLRARLPVGRART
jgi:signal transduction histidine kinase